jgi:hypothetical protein
MGYVVVPLISNLQIPYTNPDCSEYGNVRTRLIKYSSLVTLASANFNDPEGYYIAWDRCCRNDVISNIQNPDVLLRFSTQNSLPFLSTIKNLSIQLPNLKTYRATIFVSTDHLTLILVLLMQMETVWCIVW